MFIVVSRCFHEVGKYMPVDPESDIYELLENKVGVTKECVFKLFLGKFNVLFVMSPDRHFVEPILFDSVAAVW